MFLQILQNKQGQEKGLSVFTLSTQFDSELNALFIDAAIVDPFAVLSPDFKTLVIFLVHKFCIYMKILHVEGKFKAFV